MDNPSVTHAPGVIALTNLSRAFVALCGKGRFDCVESSVGRRPSSSSRATGATWGVMYGIPCPCSVIELVIGEVSSVDAYPGSLFKFTLYFSEVLQERGSAPGRQQTSIGSGMLHRD